MAVDLVLASTASALALSASAAAAADQDWQDEEFKLGGGKYESKAHAIQRPTELHTTHHTSNNSKNPTKTENNTCIHV